MTTTFRIATYFDQLEAMALLACMDLKAAFEAAGVPSSTYYRSLYGAELKAETANKVASVIRNKIAKDKRAHDATRAAAGRAKQELVS